MEDRDRELRLRARIGGAADGRVLLRKLFVEPAVPMIAAFGGRDGALEERQRLARAAERAQRLPDGVEGELDGALFFGSRSRAASARSKASSAGSSSPAS